MNLDMPMGPSDKGKAKRKAGSRGSIGSKVVPRRARGSDELEQTEARSDTGSLRRGLKILDALVKAERPLTSAEIADMVEMSPSTTHRLIQNLVEIGYVDRDSLKRYYPSARALFPVDTFHPLNIMRRTTAEELIRLRRKFGLAASVVAFVGMKRWVLETFHGNDVFSPYSSTEISVPLHATATGKLLLSTLSASQRDGVIGVGPYEKFASRTITDRTALDRELSMISSRGYVTAMDELLEGLSAIGAMIWCSPGRPLGAIVLAGLTNRFTNGEIDEYAEAVTHSVKLFSFASPDVRAACKFLGK